jgi:hypothetical protein
MSGRRCSGLRTRDLHAASGCFSFAPEVRAGDPLATVTPASFSIATEAASAAVARDCAAGGCLCKQQENKA